MPIITFYLPRYPGEVEAGGCLNVKFFGFVLFYPILQIFLSFSGIKTFYRKCNINCPFQVRSYLM